MSLRRPAAGEDGDGSLLEIAGRVLALLDAGARVAAATVIDVIGSAPNPVGTSLVLSSGGTVLGSVSNGCVEDGALEACRRVLRGGPARVLRFGFGQDAAGAGPSCGGELDVLVHAVAGAAVRRELAAAAAGRAAALGLLVSGPAAALGRALTTDGGDLPIDRSALRRLRAAADAQAATGRAGLVSAACGPSTVRAFVDTAVPAARLVLCGATATAAALASAATAAGWTVTVVDLRAALLGARNLPPTTGTVAARAHEYLATTPLDHRSAVCLLGHDEDLDPLAAAVALERGAGYVGALGSRGTTARRRERLRDLGVPDALASRLHAPIGLDLGAATPAETAISILAGLIAWRSGATGRPLRELDGAIHRPVRRSAVQQAPDPVAGHRQLPRP